MKTTKKFVETENGGYWVKESQRAVEKSPIFCPFELCRRLTGTIDDECIREYGICKKCYVKYVEDRENPLIDVEFYKNRTKERGY